MELFDFVFGGMELVLFGIGGLVCLLILFGLVVLPFVADAARVHAKHCYEELRRLNRNIELLLQQHEQQD